MAVVYLEEGGMGGGWGECYRCLVSSNEMCFKRILCSKHGTCHMGHHVVKPKDNPSAVSSVR